MSTLSFHFHGYQPGDIVGLPEPDPLRPQRIEERHSPVVLRIGPDRIEGRNWTDAVLRSYGRMGSVLGRAAGLVSGRLPGRGRSSAGSTPRTRSSVDSPRNRGPLPGDSP